MNETTVILQSLRQQLRQRGITYAAVAKHWQVSVSSVKRIMTADDISISRIESACQLMALPVSEFFQLIQFPNVQEFIYLSLKQEEALAKDARLLHFFLLLQEGWSVVKILQRYTLTNLESTGFLIRLDKLKVIELLPRNRVRKLLGGQLRFLKEGPIGKQLRNVAKSTFLESDFKTENEYLTFLSLRLTPTDVLKLKTQLLQLSKDLSIKSELRHAHDNTQELGLIIGLRPWSAPFMQALKKRNSLKRLV